MNKTKILKVIGVFLCTVGSVFIGYVAWHLIYSASSLTCLESKPEDTFDFGKALAINDSYIAVGDPKANRVAIYSYDQAEKKWSRTREIYPPKNSIIDRVGSGFGNSLIFHQNQLVIGAYSDYISSNFDEDTENKYISRGFIYSLQLDQDNQNALRRINLPEEINPTGDAINVFGDRIALETTVGKDYGKKPDKVLIVNPTTLKVESIIEPPILPTRRGNFGNSIAGNSKSLVISAPDIPTKGKVYLVDEQGEIETISMSEIFSTKEKGGFASPLALNDEFMAMNFSGWRTSIFKRFSNGWREIYSVDLFGSLSTNKSQLLISTGRYLFDGGLLKRWPNHLLIDVQRDKAFTQSTIRWHWWYYGGSAVAQGVIDSKHLLLSRRGKVVLLKKNYIPRDYVINRSFCKEK